MVISAYRDESLVIVTLQTVKTIERDQPSRYNGVNELVTNRQNYDIKHPQYIYQLDS